ncbi:MAG: hypothetical protein ABIH78_00685 [Candidatus Peregrinibacteria bacterium]
MSLESFIAGSGEPMSEAAFEAFKEKMKHAAAQIAAIKKEEGRQKKKEEELLKILLKFVKTSHKSELVLLISRVLEKNIPANFILAAILLGNEDIKSEVGDFLMLKTPAGTGTSLMFFGEKDAAMPLKLKIEIDDWIKNMLFQAEESPHKLLKTAYEAEPPSDKPAAKKPAAVLIQLLTFVLRDFLEQHDVFKSYENLREFSMFIAKGILAKTKENLDNRDLLAG